ncbi:nucleotidyltransferase family protein [Streptomyces iconiensis]|uniref:Nucleotidyltransferase family protein n=1 Tax=Streptomyces iconiensis TaxID=1384038 RepID=A0ABT6ZUX4_9ACTN|nr:nucleotidyltransferase family protein [Streptomyces iconiensis]MDJ1132850.1 nucleotidyltransferase family protein [Streptomyces iconiensis]
MARIDRDQTGAAPSHPAAEPPAGELPVAGLLLAAGGGRRLGGRPKALLQHAGRPLVEHAVRVLREGGCEQVYVVLGAAREDVRARARLDGCVLVDNPDWAQGMGTSLCAGLERMTRDGAAGAALVSLVDQPGIGAGAVARVRAAHTSPGSLAAASYEGRRGHPVLFGARHWPGVLASAHGDVGARAYLGGHGDDLALIECGDIADLGDIDTPEDLARLAP